MNSEMILVVEDDDAIRNLICAALDLAGYHYHTAKNGNQAMLEAVSQKPELILLDLGLPDMDGVDVIRRIRGWSTVPITVISARSDEKDKIDALDAGADDYLTKPFSTDELLARIRGVQRRIRYMESGSVQNPDFENGNLRIDYAMHRVSVNDREIHLTPTEYGILCLLARNTGRVLTHFYITKEIWGSSTDGDIASLRVHMATLRKKIENSDHGRKYIITHVGVGYCMVRPDAQ
ncbi:MAG: response regulator transcription factor [Bulleidia sp.]